MGKLFFTNSLKRKNINFVKKNMAKSYSLFTDSDIRALGIEIDTEVYTIKNLSELLRTLQFIIS